MKKVAVLVADAFQDSEYFLPKIEIEKLGVETETISLSKSPVEIYSFFRTIGHLNIDKAIDEAKSGDYVGVLVPGGAKSPAILAQDERVLSFLQEIDEARKMVAPICRGIKVARAVRVFRLCILVRITTKSEARSWQQYTRRLKSTVVRNLFGMLYGT